MRKSLYFNKYIICSNRLQQKRSLLSFAAYNSYICTHNLEFPIAISSQYHKKSSFIEFDISCLSTTTFRSIFNLLMTLNGLPFLGFIIGFNVFHSLYTEFCGYQTILYSI